MVEIKDHNLKQYIEVGTEGPGADAGLYGQSDYPFDMYFPQQIS